MKYMKKTRGKVGFNGTNIASDFRVKSQKNLRSKTELICCGGSLYQHLVLNLL
jgi:hypothetical protein